jgi:coenzyme F420-0:L-glutamate ligase/coenzyme F420-1:gamma-L-glutamate ligase
VVVLRGLGRFVLPPDDDGRGAAALVRDEAGDLFGYGTRDAVVNAVASSGDDRGFGAPALTDELVLALEAALGDAATVRVDGGAVLVEPTSGDPRAAGRVEGGAAAVARAHGWTAGSPEVLRFRPRTP